MSEIKFNEEMHKFTLIYGVPRSGKTYLLRYLVLRMIKEGIIDYAYIFAFNLSKEWSFINPKCCKMPDDGTISKDIKAKEREIRRENISNMKKMTEEELLVFINRNIPQNYPRINTDGVRDRSMREIYDFIKSFDNNAPVTSSVDAINKICRTQENKMNKYNFDRAKHDQGLRPKPKLPRCRCAIIFDDSMQCHKLFNNEKFFSFATRFRHLNMWLYISTQNINAIVPRTRNNANRKIIFKPNGQVSLDNAIEYITGHKRDNQLCSTLMGLREHEFLLVDDEDGIRKIMICPLYNTPRGIIRFGVNKSRN